MKRRLISTCFLLVLVLSLTQFIGCATNAVVFRPGPTRAVFPTELGDALRSSRSEVSTDADSAGIRYHIVIDSRVASNAGSSGYMQSGCQTFQSILACCRNTISTEKYSGYLTCDPYTVYQMDPVMQESIAVGSSVYEESASVFSIAANGRCPRTRVMPSQVIAQMAEATDENSVHIFITDLAMPQSSDAYMIVDALTENVISNNDLSMGLIGVQADFVGTVTDIPITNVGVELPGKQIYQKPIYLLFIGEKKTVFSSMDHFLHECESNDGLSANGQVQSIYYYKYDRKGVSTASVLAPMQQDVSVAYSGLLPKYMLTPYDIGYVFSDIPENAEIAGLAAAMPFGRVYSGILADARISDETDNVTFSFHLPYAYVSDTGSAESQQLKPGQTLDFADGELTLTSQLQRLKYSLSDRELHFEGWVPANGSGLSLSRDSVHFDLDSGVVTATGKLDVAQLEQDNPAIFEASFHVSYTPSDAQLSQIYDTAWLSDWQMDIDTLQKDWTLLETRFREGVKSPYLAEVFSEMLLGAHLSAVKSSIMENDASFDRSAVFGLILREQARYYDYSTDWDDDEGFGWAFSQNEITALAAANAE